jgi:hypothetical protein
MIAELLQVGGRILLGDNMGMDQTLIYDFALLKI